MHLHLFIYIYLVYIASIYESINFVKDFYKTRLLCLTPQRSHKGDYLKMHDLKSRAFSKLSLRCYLYFIFSSDSSRVNKGIVSKGVST
jgi:hypothetical protein